MLVPSRHGGRPSGQGIAAGAGAALHLSPNDGVTVALAADDDDLGYKTVLGPEVTGRTRFLAGARFGTEGVLARAGLNDRFAAF